MDIHAEIEAPNRVLPSNSLEPMPKQAPKRWISDPKSGIIRKPNLTKGIAEMTGTQGFKIGYARVSTEDQNVEAQIAALKAAGCVRVFSEHASGALAANARPQLSMALDLIGEGVTLVVAKLDRLARDTREMLSIAERVGEAGGGLQSLSEPWADTTSPAGTLVLTIMAGVAQFERARIAERRTEGIERAKARGVYKGRKRSIDRPQVAKLLRLGMGPAEVARTVKCSESSVYAIRDAARADGTLVEAV